MKKSIMTLIAFVLMSSTAMAQDNQKRPERPKMDKKELTQKRTDRMVKQYGLNSKQAQLLQELNLSYADKMGPHSMGPRPAGGPRPHGPRGRMGQGGQHKGPDFGQRPEGPRPEGKQRQPSEEMKKRFAQRETHMKAYKAELKKIMTAEQFKKYEADEAKRPQMRRHRGGLKPKGMKE